MIPFVEMLAEPPAFGEIAHKSLREEAFSSAVGGPLKLLVALRHVFEEILHPEQSVVSIKHRECIPWSGKKAAESVRRCRESDFRRVSQ